MAVEVVTKPKWLHVKVIDNSTPEHKAINVKMPMGLVKWGMKMAQAFSPEMKDVNVNWDELTAAIEQDVPGKLVEVEDEVQRRTVDVWV